MEERKRQHGIYYTQLFNPFRWRVFLDWIESHHLKDEHVLEPFAGANAIIQHLQDVGMAKRFTAYDINPQHQQVQKRDTIKHYPKGYSLCMTNPPWLYKSSAKRRQIAFPDTEYDDLYKLCLDLALKKNAYVGALVPASFIQSGLFQHRLERLVFINRPLFQHTEMPVCLALFGNKESADVRVYQEDHEVGRLSALRKHLPKPASLNGLVFNHPQGDLGLIGIDNHERASIRFCRGEALARYGIKHSSRSITRIACAETSAALIKRLNQRIRDLRHQTHDVFLTPFKGLRKDGRYRRRLDYRLARAMIGECLNDA